MEEAFYFGAVDIIPSGHRSENGVFCMAFEDMEELYKDIPSLGRGASY